MSQSSDSKIVQLEKGIDVVCPTCGVLVVNKTGLKPQPSCEHVRFIYCNGECFEYIEPALKTELEKAKAFTGVNNDILACFIHEGGASNGRRCDFQRKLLVAA